MSVHSTAIVSPKANLSDGVEIGPYTVVGEDVTIGSGTKIASHAVIQGPAEIGAQNRIGVGAVIGLDPQDLAYRGERSFVKIGDHNDIREYVQIHRGTKEGSVTTVGNHNFLLGFSHVAHNCQIGDYVILANGALLAGYAQVGNYAFISGHCLVHQFCRIGESAMMRGGSRISLDLPPYCVADDANTIRGINSVGLERRGFTSASIKEIKRIYKELFHSKIPLSETIKTLKQTPLSPQASLLVDFIQTSPRGICRPQ
ncbi:MAG: acyl-ACP--UDP-N-acetylglucosamine O-acyltransferase [Elusimicrobia bacterium]|nr:acyl-ACP--UDP-N-acetylglucosamine O-acyltransferase [Elusimicrobiota bacterium]